MGLKEEFYYACFKGNLQKVKFLSSQVDVNWKNPKEFNRTGLHAACDSGKKEIVEYLLTLPHIDVNMENKFEWSPLWDACWNGNEEIVKILLKHCRVDVNKAEIRYQQTPLWMACQNGKEEIVKILLASGREIDTTKKGEDYWTCGNGKYSSPAEIARNRGFERIATLVEDYASNPRQVSIRLRKEIGWTMKSAEIFVFSAMICDGLLAVKADKNQSKAGRFFSILSQLHLDLQMVLINRSQMLSTDFIPATDLDIASSTLLVAIETPATEQKLTRSKIAWSLLANCTVL